MGNVVEGGGEGGVEGDMPPWRVRGIGGEAEGDGEEGLGGVERGEKKGKDRMACRTRVMAPEV